MLYFFDNQEKLLGYIDNESSLSVIQTEPLRGVIVLEASVIDGYSELLEASTYVGHVDAVNDDSFQLYRIKSISLGNENVGAKISAQHVVFDELSSRDIIRKVSFNGLNMSAVFMEILKESRWKLGECNVNKSVNLSAENTNVSNLITTLINKYSIELRYRLKFANNKIIGRFIDVFENRGRNTHKRYAYGHNALSVVKEIDSNNLYTAIIPHGKEIEQSEEDRKAKKEKQKLDITKIAWSKLKGNYVDKKIGEDTLELKELSQIYGFSDGSPRTMFKNYDIDDENELIKTAYEDLVNLARPKVQFSAKIEDLGELDIGDSIVIIRSDLGIYYRTRVIEIKRNLIEYGLSELVLGDNLDLKNPQKSTNKLSKQISDLETQINNINVETNKVKDSIKDTSFLDDLRKQLKEGMYDHDSYNYFLKKGNEYGLPPGFYAFNKPIDQNPTSGIWMNGGKMAIANKRNADGTLNWSTWLNGEGIIADYITAGILQGGKVRWNLEDGTFLIGNSINDYSFYWDGSTLHMRDVDIDLTNNSTVKGISESVDKNNADIKKANEVITQTQTSVQILKDSISSKVSKTEILTDKEIQNALKGRDGIDGADGIDGSNFTWNLIKKSRSDVRISSWSNSKLEILDEKYQFPEMNVNDAKKIKFSDGDSWLKGFLTYGANLSPDMIKGNKYTVSIYIENLSDTDLEIKFNGFNWQSHKLKPNEKRYVICKGEYDGNANQVQFHVSPEKELIVAYGLLKAEAGYNDNPVWSPHISEIKGEKGDRGEQGLRGLRGLQGRDGRDGIQGKDGASSFTHIAYSNSDDGSKDFSTSNSNREYIGIYVDSNKTDLENYKAYKWSKIKGLDGKNGIPGKAGADGKTSYLHIAYSNSQDGSKDFSTTDSDRDYIGTYTDFSKADSTDYKKYSWSKIKGEFEGEIGARNLLKNSDDLSNYFVKYDGGTHTITDEEMTEFGFSGKKVFSLRGNQTTSVKSYLAIPIEKLVVGKTYTFSMYVKNNRDVSQRIIINGFDWSYYDIKGNEAVRIVLTGKRTETSDSWKDRIQILLCSYDKEWYADMTVSRPQLEEGDVATSWKPNPLDLISETQAVKRTFEAYKEQTDRRLLSTVSQTDFNKNNVAIQKQFSSVDQKANEITSTVSSNYTDLSKKIDGKPSVSTVQSLISQKVDSVKIEVSNQISGVRSSISVMQGKIELKADKTDLYGLVSFSDLKDSNSWTVINGENIKTGKISSADGSSWINLKDGNFSFYHNSLFIDENEYDWSSRTRRTRLHTLGTFRVSYGDNPSVELNSGGITLFKDKVSQDSKGTNKIQSNSDGNVQIGSIDGSGSTNIQVEIGSTVNRGFVMRTYGSLRVSGNLQVDHSIKYGGYGGSISQDKYY